MREPSIHITKTKLKELLEEYGKGVDHWDDTDALVNYLLVEGSRFQLTHRKGLKHVSKNLEKTIAMASRSYKADAQLFSKVYQMLRRDRKHRSIAIIKEGNAQWNIIKEATKLATDFCKDFNLSINDGYKTYLTIAMDMVDKFNLNKLNYRHETICEQYEALQEISLDENPQITEQVYEEYYKIISSKTGITNDYKKQPRKYVYFVKAAKIIKELKVDSYDYVYAQFKSLEWINGLPDPAQLVGDLALERFQKHIYKSNKRVVDTMSSEDLLKLVGRK